MKLPKSEFLPKSEKLPRSEKLSYKGVVRFKFKPRKRGYTLAEIKKQAEKVSTKIGERKKNFGIEVAVRYPHYWYANYITKAGKQVDVTSHQEEYDDEEPEKFPEFVIYVIGDAFKKGGDSEHNDCLFECINKIVKKNPFPNPKYLKQYLNLKRDDKIDIALIPKIEKRLKTYKINVSGDHSYISTKPSQQIINLKLLKGHYTIDKTKQQKIIVNISDIERIPLMHTRRNNADIVYNPEIKKEWRIIDSRKYWEIVDFQTKYILIPTDKYNKDKTLKQEYDEFIKDADILKKETNGKINLYKTGTNKATAINLFNELYNCDHPDPILQHEAEFYLKCNSGAIIHCEKYKGKCYKYDVCSMYPFMMNSTMCFPYKKGEFKKISELPDILTYGIYRCEIKNTKPKLFRTNFNDYYTHIDIYRARALKLKITLTEDDEPNALLYSRDKLLTGSQMFGKYVKYLFELKQKKITGRAKQILNILWGVLCERDLCNLKSEVIADDKKPTIELGKNKKHMFFKPWNDNQTIIKYQDNDHVFKTDFARIKPFILAKGRTILSKLIEPCIDDVVLAHTDGFIVKTKQKIKTGTKLGDVKYEGCCQNANIFSPSQKKVKGINDFQES